MFPSDTRILVIDDMGSSRNFLIQLLKMQGYKYFYQADNGISAYDLLSSQDSKSEPIELIFCDIVMPKMGGPEFIRKIRGEDLFKTLPVLVITAELEPSYVKSAIDAGANNFLYKPYSVEKLKNKIDILWNSLP